MRRPVRSLSIFSLSALDLLAMATGTFVLLVVILMPYYRMTQEGEATIQAVESATSAQLRSLVAEDRRVQAERRSVEALSRETRALDEQIAALRRATRRLDQEATRLDAQGRTASDAARQLHAEAQRRIVRALDLVFVVDTTASMSRVLENLSLSLTGIVRVLERLVPSLRVGFVAYRDHDVGGWVTRTMPLTPTATGLQAALTFASSLSPLATGGPTVTEALYDGLQLATAMQFRPDAKQTIVVIGDAAAHAPDQPHALAAARAFAQSDAGRSVAALFVPTLAYLQYGHGDREFFAALARAGRGQFTLQVGEIMEGVLLSILDN